MSNPKKVAFDLQAKEQAARTRGFQVAIYDGDGAVVSGPVSISAVRVGDRLEANLPDSLFEVSGLPNQSVSIGVVAIGDGGLSGAGYSKRFEVAWEPLLVSGVVVE